jgi:chaperonin GroEL (HSP60 family)
LAGWFGKDEERNLAYIILEKAEELIHQSVNPLDIHFFYNSEIEIFYRDRDKPGGLEKAVYACRQQIDYASKAAKAFKKEYKDEFLQSHRGYTQLAIILEKQKNYSEVIEVCTQAMEQGWLGDWKNRIERCRKKGNK